MKKFRDMRERERENLGNEMKWVKERDAINKA